MSPNKSMPVLLVTPGAMSAKDIRRAEKLGGFCIIECKDPEASRFVDAPLGATLDDQARAGMWLVRYIVGHKPNVALVVGDLIKFYVDQLITRPSPDTLKPATPVAKVKP